eukprot:2016376-Rhodomonas_salina.3
MHTSATLQKQTRVEASACLVRERSGLCLLALAQENFEVRGRVRDEESGRGEGCPCQCRRAQVRMRGRPEQPKHRLELNQPEPDA